MNNKVSLVLAGYVAMSAQEQRQFVFDLADHILALPLGTEGNSSEGDIEIPLPAGESFGPPTIILNPSRVI